MRERDDESSALGAHEIVPVRAREEDSAKNTDRLPEPEIYERGDGPEAVLVLETPFDKKRRTARSRFMRDW